MTSMNDVDIETGKVQVEVFNQTDAALAVLREEFATVPDFKTTTGYEAGAQGLKKITKYRTTLEKKRKEIKDPYLKAGQIIDAEAKRITEALKEIEEPLAAAKKEVDDHEKRLKEQRIAKLRAKIQDMVSYAERARNKPSNEVAEMIEVVDAIDTQGEFYDLREEAVKAQQDTLQKMGDIYSDRIQFEQAEVARQQAEQARKEADERAQAQQREQQINERLNKLRMMPMELMGKSAEEIRNKLASLNKFTPPADEFGAKLEEAKDAQATVTGQLEMMLQQAEQLEAAKAQQQAEQRLKDDQLTQDMASAPKAPAPEYTGVDTASGPDTTVTAEIKAATPGMAQEEAERTQGTGVIPDSDKLDVGDAIAQHEQQHSNVEQALSDLEGALVAADIEVSAEAAMVVLDAIMSGAIRHVGFFHNPK